MCTALIAINAIPEQPLLILHNRDEFYSRPSKPLSWWAEGVLAGRDLQSCGTWFGVNRHGSFCFVTNYRDPSLARENARSRGLLVSEFLTKNIAIDEASKLLEKSSDNYNPFNIVYGCHDQTIFYSSQSKKTTKLTTGIYGLSNAYLDTPWPKVQRGKKLLNQALANNAEEEAFWSILKDSSRAPKSELPSTGIPVELESVLSSLFVASPDYGTRSSTILKINRGGLIQFTERRFSCLQKLEGEASFQFKTPL